MNEAPSPGRGFSQGGAFRYGMFVLIAALWCAACWTWVTRTPQERPSASINVVVTSMLLVNHVIASFLSIERQRRIRVVQFIFVSACTAYVFSAPFVH